MALPRGSPRASGGAAWTARECSIGAPSARRAVRGTRTTRGRLLLAKLRTNLVDFWQFFAVPGIAALLPWRLAYRWLRRVARGTSAFDEPARAARAVLPQHLDVNDIERFAANVRLHWLLDTTDLYLSLLRRKRAWRPWHVERVGEWPRDGRFVVAGFHHGNGHWMFKSLAEAGHDSVIVSARWDKADYPGLPVRYRYGSLRGYDIGRLSGRPPIFRPRAKEQLAAALDAGYAVIGVLDMPPRLAPNGQRPVRLLDRDVCFPAGMLELAQAGGVPVVPYWMEYDLDRGVRRLVIGDPLDPAAPDTLQRLADLLDAAIRKTPSAWFFWPEWPLWIEQSPDAIARTGEKGQSAAYSDS